MLREELFRGSRRPILRAMALVVWPIALDVVTLGRRRASRSHVPDIQDDLMAAYLLPLVAAPPIAAGLAYLGFELPFRLLSTWLPFLLPAIPVLYFAHVAAVPRALESGVHSAWLALTVKKSRALDWEWRDDWLPVKRAGTLLRLAALESELRRVSGDEPKIRNLLAEAERLEAKLLGSEAAKRRVKKAAASL